jgi:acyl carrier protein
MEEKVLEILKSVLELDQVEKTISSTNCENWDSMAQLNISVELEAEFGVSLEPEEIAAMASYEDIVRILKEKGVTA